MPNYINKITDVNSEEYSIYDSRLKQGGAKAFWYKSFYYLDENDEQCEKSQATQISFTACDKTGQVTSISLPSPKYKLSSKADFSASFAGTVITTNGSVITATIDLSDLINRANWNPDWYAYDFGGTKTYDGKTYVFTANQDEFTIDGVGGNYKSDWGYFWFPIYPSIGEFEIGTETAIATTNNSANEIYSFAEGGYTIADGRYSHAEGRYSQAAYAAHAEGYNTKAYGLQSHTEGLSTKAVASCSHAEGSETTASAAQSHAEGYQTTASGIQSHAEGYQTIASGAKSHTQGKSTNASGENSTAIGENSTASGLNSFAGGKYGNASGERSFAFGLSTQAKSTDSAAFGFQTQTGTGVQGQFVRGLKNVVLGAGYLDIVGGPSTKNIYVLDTSGNLYIRGELYIKASNDACTQGTKFPAPPATGNYVLKSSNGIMSWELDS